MHVKHFILPFMSIGLLQKKSKERAWTDDVYTLLKKTLEIYRFVTLPLENKLSTLEIPQICTTPIRNFKTNGKST